MPFLVSSHQEGSESLVFPSPESVVTSFTCLPLFGIRHLEICLQRGHRRLKLSFLHIQTSLNKDCTKKMTQVLTVEDLKKKNSCFSACDINQVNGPIR